MALSDTITSLGSAIINLVNTKIANAISVNNTEIQEVLSNLQAQIDEILAGNTSGGGNEGTETSENLIYYTNTTATTSEQHSCTVTRGYSGGKSWANYLLDTPITIPEYDAQNYHYSGNYIYFDLPQSGTAVICSSTDNTTYSPMGSNGTSFITQYGDTVITGSLTSDNSEDRYNISITGTRAQFQFYDGGTTPYYTPSGNHTQGQYLWRIYVEIETEEYTELTLTLNTGYAQPAP